MFKTMDLISQLIIFSLPGFIMKKLNFKCIKQDKQLESKWRESVIAKQSDIENPSGDEMEQMYLDAFITRWYEFGLKTFEKDPFSYNLPDKNKEFVLNHTLPKLSVSYSATNFGNDSDCETDIW